MSAIVWIASVALCMNIFAHSSVLPDFLFFTIVSIAVCGSVGAFLATTEASETPDRDPQENTDQTEAEMLRHLADQTAFAKTRCGLLELAQRLDERGASSGRTAPPILTAASTKRAG